MPPARAYLRDTFRSVGCRNRLLSVLRADQACMYMQAQTLTCLNSSGLNMSNEVAETLKASQHTHPSRFFSMGVTAPRAHISTDALAKWFKASTLPPLSHITNMLHYHRVWAHAHIGLSLGRRSTAAPRHISSTLSPLMMCCRSGKTGIIPFRLTARVRCGLVSDTYSLMQSCVWGLYRTLTHLCNHVCLCVCVRVCVCQCVCARARAHVRT